MFSTLPINHCKNKRETSPKLLASNTSTLPVKTKFLTNNNFTLSDIKFDGNANMNMLPPSDPAPPPPVRSILPMRKDSLPQEGNQNIMDILVLIVVLIVNVVKSKVGQKRDVV